MKKTISLFAVMLSVLVIGFASCTTGQPSTTDDPKVHECDSVCDFCGKCTDADCDEDACKSKCDEHVNLPEIDVDDLN